MGKRKKIHDIEFYHLYFQTSFTLFVFYVYSKKIDKISVDFKPICDLELMIKMIKEKIGHVDSNERAIIEYNLSFLEKILSVIDPAKDSIDIDLDLIKNMNVVSSSLSFTIEYDDALGKLTKKRIILPFCKDQSEVLKANEFSCNTFISEITQFLKSKDINPNNQNTPKRKVTINPYHSEKYFFYDFQNSSSQISKQFQQKIAFLGMDSKKIIIIKHLAINIYSIRSPCDSCELLMSMPKLRAIQNFLSDFAENLTSNITFPSKQYSINFRYSWEIINEFNGKRAKTAASLQNSSLFVDQRKLELNNVRFLDFLKSHKLKFDQRNFYLSSPSHPEFKENLEKKDKYFKFLKKCQKVIENIQNLSEKFAIPPGILMTQQINQGIITQ